MQRNIKNNTSVWTLLIRKKKIKQFLISVVSYQDKQATEKRKKERIKKKFTYQFSFVYKYFLL